VSKGLQNEKPTNKERLTTIVQEKSLLTEIKPSLQVDSENRKRLLLPVAAYKKRVAQRKGEELLEEIEYQPEYAYEQAKLMISDLTPEMFELIAVSYAVRKPKDALKTAYKFGDTRLRNTALGTLLNKARYSTIEQLALESNDQPTIELINTLKKIQNDPEEYKKVHEQIQQEKQDTEHKKLLARFASIEFIESHPLAAYTFFKEEDDQYLARNALTQLAEIDIESIELMYKNSKKLEDANTVKEIEIAVSSSVKTVISFAKQINCDELYAKLTKRLDQIEVYTQAKKQGVEEIMQKAKKYILEMDAEKTYSATRKAGQLELTDLIGQKVLKEDPRNAIFLGHKNNSRELINSAIKEYIAQNPFEAYCDEKADRYAGIVGAGILKMKAETAMVERFPNATYDFATKTKDLRLQQIILARKKGFRARFAEKMGPKYFPKSVDHLTAKNDMNYN
jgi:hypothetical protein